jgi:ribosomal protein S18 acetylase RimI-like enzyme
VPVREWFSIFNSVFYDRPDALERRLAALGAAYKAAGIKAWTVWVPPGDHETARLLDRRGHEPDSTPMLFAASIDSLDLNPLVDLDIDPDPTWKLVAEINDRAHGVLEEWSMAAIFQSMNDPASNLHVARHNGTPACALIAREHEADCYFWFVATIPEARGRGLASELMRHALRAALERGCTTTTLESTKMAESLYSRLGYRSLGRYELWESRTA